MQYLSTRADAGLIPSLRRLIGGLALALVCIGATPAVAQTAWIVQQTSTNIARIDTTTDTVVAGTTPVGNNPFGVLATATRVYVANFGSGSVTVLDATTAAFVANITVGTQPFGLALSPDGSRLFVANRVSNTVSVINTANNGLVGTPLTGGTTTSGVAVSPDGATVYIANEGANTVTARTVATNALVRTYTGFTGPRQIILSSDGATAYVTNYGGNTVGVLTLATGGITNLTVGSLPWGVTRSPDGSTVYVASYGTNSVSRVLTATNAVTTVAAGTNPIGVSTTPDGSKLYVVNDGSSNVSVFNATTMAPITTIAVGARPASMGQFIAASAAPAPVAVPTLSEWAMILFGLVLAGSAALYIQRRRQFA